jgi:D-glycerate 3-kinase
MNGFLEDFYLPLYSYLKSMLLNKKLDGLSSSADPLLVGISAPQGCGKTTLTDFMRILFESEGYKCIAVSIDDFYLKGEDQDDLARKYPDNPLLKFRGNGSCVDSLQNDTSLLQYYTSYPYFCLFSHAHP